MLKHNRIRLPSPHFRALPFLMVILLTQGCSKGVQGEQGYSLFLALQLVGTANTDLQFSSLGLPIADTGQKDCYNNSAMANCENASFPRQDGDIVSPASRDLTDQLRHPTFPTDQIIVDRVTGLIWQKCLLGTTGSSCNVGSFQAVTYEEAMSACDALNEMNSGNGFAGSNTWRLPSIEALSTIIHYGMNDPSIDPLFPGNVARLWSSSEIDVSTAYSVSTSSGFRSDSTKGTSAAVRCVTGTYYSPIFADQGDGTVLEERTGLLFQKCMSGQNNDSTCSGTRTEFTWQNGLQYCRDLTLAGRSDWRLPSINELLLIVDSDTNHSVKIDPSLFPNAYDGDTFASTTDLSDLLDAWSVHFATGTTLPPYSPKGNDSPVRCVAP